MRSAPILPLGLALLLGIGVWIVVASNAENAAEPPASAGERSRSNAPPAGPARSERERAAEARDLPTAAATAPVEAPRVEPVDTATNVELRVRRVADHGDVPMFTWRFRSEQTVQHGDGQHGRAGVHLSPLASGELLVEAPGFAPFTTDVVIPGPGAPPLPIDAFLAATTRATGITLLVHDTALQPIANVRVDAFPLLAEGSRAAWHLGASLWARRAEAADGRYELPELAPGDYGIRVLAVDAEGELLPLLPYLHTFALTGSSGYVEDVTLEPACVPAFELVDTTGAPLDPSRAGIVDVHLHLAGAPPVARMWTVVRDGRAITALDALPAVGTVAPAQPVAGGTYSLVIAIDGQQRVQQFVTLRAGERQHERIVVP